jgi:hypothetical protein
MVSLRKRMPKTRLTRLSLLVHQGLLAQRVPLAPVVRVPVKEVSGPWLRRVVIRSQHRIDLLLVVVVAEDLLVPPPPSKTRKYLE